MGQAAGRLWLGWQPEYLLGQQLSKCLVPDQLCLLPSLLGDVAHLMD